MVEAKAETAVMAETVAEEGEGEQIEAQEEEQ